MYILYFISHTHWDREWHEPFQIFRLRLAQTIDKALGILATDPDYKYFMLDGQTIVLEDYLEIEPQHEAELRGHIESGRVLIGPWYVLPDEFLVSGEAIIRNLQRGIRIARSYGNCMMIGYIPDPFGHISQMPQILAGFGIQHAMFRRGLADEQTELWWEGADGTRVLTTYLRDGYDNAAWLPREPGPFAQGVKRLVDSLSPYSATDNLLMMHGTDHMQPWKHLPRVMREAAERLPEVRFLHSNLPAYSRAVQQTLSSAGQDKLGVVRGELRNPKRHHLLPGVTSTRMWIKQRNARAQTLLERWAEPVAALSANLARAQNTPRRDLSPELRLAWKYLLQNHPHDSICGCSADQVHLEMAPRFDWVEQIGGDLVRYELESIVRSIDTHSAKQGNIPIVVFNPTAGPRGDAVHVQVDLPVGLGRYAIIDEAGRVLPSFESRRRIDEYARVTATADDLRWMFGAMKSGRVDGHLLRGMSFRVEDGQVYLEATVSDQGTADPARLETKLAELDRYVADPMLKTFHVRVVSSERVDLHFFAPDLPGYGFKTFWLEDSPDAVPASAHNMAVNARIENEFFVVEPNREDGTLNIIDKTTGARFTRANRFVDGGDSGDLYNYCAPDHDQLVASPLVPPSIQVVEDNSVRRVLRIQSVLRVPASISGDRRSRSSDLVDIPINTEVTLYNGLPRIDFQTHVENSACDHRLRVEFPTPIQALQAIASQAFDLVARGTELPQAAPEWVEKPVPTKPMQDHVAIDDGKIGLVLAARGLPEYEIIPSGRVTQEGVPQTESGLRASNDGATIVLTLLRCVEWLSRPDLTCRRGDAGPEKLTPGAQEQGAHVFEYSLIPITAAIDSLNEKGTAGSQPLERLGAHMTASCFTAPLRAVPADDHGGRIPSSASWIQVSPREFVLTAIKPPEEGEGLIVRGFNSSDETITVRLKPIFPFDHASRVNLNEETTGHLHWNEAHEVEFAAKQREIVTARFEW